MLRFQAIVRALVAAWLVRDDDFWDWDPRGMLMDEEARKELSLPDGPDLDPAMATERQMHSSLAG